MYIQKILKIKKSIFMPIVLLLIMVIFGLNVGVTRAFAASEVYGIRQSDGWHSCDSSGGNIGAKMNDTDYKNITNAFIGEDVTKVDNVTRGRFTSLKKIVFMGNKVTNIGNGAFYDSQALESVIIPESVRYIGDVAFFNCTNLTNFALMNKQTVYDRSGGTIFASANSNLRVYVYPTNERLIDMQRTKVPYKTVIAPPADLKADLAEGITLNWTANTDATSYKVFRSDSQDGTYTQLIGNTTSTTYTDSTAEKGKRYWYKVYSVYDTRIISNWTDGPVLESDPSVVQTSFSITQVSSQRNSTNTATVKFTSNEEGQYYYAVVGDGENQPYIDTNITGTYCINGENTINLSNLTAGAKDIYIVSKDGSGILSNVLKVDIDYDVTKVRKVTYNGNGNTAGSIPAEASYLEGDSVTVAKQGDLLKSEYIFLGWNTKQDGTGTDYKPDETIAIGTEDVTLYARWEEEFIPVNEINLSQNPINLTLGQTKTLTADITPSNATNQKVIWNSSDPNVAAVENGVVTPVAEGTATITATTDDETKTASCEVAVTSADCKIKYQEIQKKFNSSNNTYDISFFATIDTLDSDEAGFIFSKTKMIPVKGQVKDTNIKSTTKVYKSVTDKDSNITTAESKGGNYIIECTVERIPQEDADKPLYVRAFVVKDSKIQYTPVYVVRASEIS